MKALLLQHGESEADLKGLFSTSGYHDGLTETGRKQIWKTALSLQEEYGTLSAIYTSPLKRAVETAGICSEIFDIPFRTADELCDIDAGKFDGKPVMEHAGETERIFERWFHDRDQRTRFPGGERISAAVERITSFMRRLEEHDIKDAPPFLLIGHERTFLAGIVSFTQNISGSDAADCSMNPADMIPVIYSSIWKGWMCEHTSIKAEKN